jgi:Flp pilus assembly protein TadG
MQEGKSMNIRNMAGIPALRNSFGGLMTRLRRAAAIDAGSALVEMAVSSAILFSMFIGVYEVCLASYASHYVAEAAREGARYAIVRGSVSCVNTSGLSNCNASSDTVATYVKGLQYPGITPANLTVNVSYLTGTSSTSTGTTLTTWAACSSGTCNLPGNMVTVQVSYAFGLAIPFGPTKTVNVTSTSQMVIQQ